MADERPTELERLLTADAALRDDAWDAFVGTYTRLLLHTCRTVSREPDAAMDAYAHVLAALREDDCRRLRAYAPVPGSKFTTWLVMVARRLAVDQLRKRYGQVRADAGNDTPRQVRARLADLLAEELDPERVPGSDANPESELRARQLGDAIASVVGELEPRDRLLVALRFTDDRSAREIAGIMGFATPFHVYRRINAVLNVLKEGLRRRGVEEPIP